MKDLSTILLIQILRAIVDRVELSPDIDPARRGVREVRRTLFKQIVRLQGSEAHGI